MSVAIVSAAVAGDYNGDFLVNAADYTIWRNTLGSMTDLRANGNDADASAGKIDQADFDFWKSRFGADSGSGGISASAAPEPTWATLPVELLKFLAIRPT